LKDVLIDNSLSRTTFGSSVRRFPVPETDFPGLGALEEEEEEDDDDDDDVVEEAEDVEPDGEKVTDTRCRPVAGIPFGGDAIMGIGECGC
jgi:hypothetical protein